MAPLELDEVTYLEQVSVRSAAVGLERSRSEQLIRAWLEKLISPGHRRCRTRSSVEGSRWPTWMGWNRPFLPRGSMWW